MLENLLYRIIKGLWISFSCLPFWAIYRLSDLFFYIVFYVGRYRRRVVRANLISSFPEKSLPEIQCIERKFYQYLCDCFVESTKLATMSHRTMKRRMRVVNAEDVNREIRAGRSVSLFLGHYANWEWVSSLPLWLEPTMVGGQVYHRLHNRLMDRLMIFNRERMGTQCVEMHDILRWIHTQHANRLVSVTGYIADQSPSRRNVRYFLPFLHHNIPVLIGAERITQKYGFTAFYVELKRVKRGYYEAQFVRMPNEKPSAETEYPTTEWYYRLLEQTIRRQPELYLWTHKRFKYAKPDPII